MHALRIKYIIKNCMGMYIIRYQYIVITCMGICNIRIPCMQLQVIIIIIIIHAVEPVYIYCGHCVMYIRWCMVQIMQGGLSQGYSQIKEALQCHVLYYYCACTLRHVLVLLDISHLQAPNAYYYARMHVILGSGPALACILWS